MDSTGFAQSSDQRVPRFSSGERRRDDLTDRDRLRVSFRHNEIRYLVPNELVQQEAGQRQDAADTETSGQVDYQRVLSPTLLFSAEGSLREPGEHALTNQLGHEIGLLGNAIVNRGPRCLHAPSSRSSVPA